MSPTIRIDDQVMEVLKEQAIRLGLVFESPNAVLRAVLGLDQGNKEERENLDLIEIQLRTIYTPRRWSLIPIPKDKRTFFPGYKVEFQLSTDISTITTHMTSALKGTPIGDPKAGAYIQGGLRSWYVSHPELQDGAKLQIKALQPGKHYQLSIIHGQKE